MLKINSTPTNEQINLHPFLPQLTREKKDIVVHKIQ